MDAGRGAPDTTVKSGPGSSRGDAGSGAASGPRRRAFRPDIEGLRAVAVLAVVLYHAHVSVLGGGFDGVDVFFVVSGYLITGLLWRELNRDGRVSLSAFYGRRARRLLPAAILVVVVTALAARRWMPPLELPSVMKDGVASSLYVANYRFALQHTSYLAPTRVVSPFQQFWSLGAEEQFYLVWPLLLLGASLVWRRPHRYQHYRWRDPKGGRGGPDRFTALAVLVAVTVFSCVLSIWLTHVNQPWAFFSLPTRAWELGAGGVLALSAPYVRRIPAAAATVVGWVGLTVIVLSFFLITPSTPYPGTAALAPVIGTVLVIASGEVAALRANAIVRRQGPAKVLARPPMRAIGRISYSWYLWHWPFLILAPYVLGYTLSLWQNLFVAALSGAVAAISYAVVETPARTSAWLASIPRRSLLTGGTLSAGGALVCILVAANLPSLTGHGVARVASIHTNPISSTRGAAPSPARTPATTVDPLQAQISSINAQIAAQLSVGVGITEVPSNLHPTLAEANTDDPPVFVDGCMDSYLDSSVQNCEFGDLASNTSVVIFGDSHAGMWFPAVDVAANQHGWRLYTWTKATCPPLNLPIYSPELGRTFTECETWRQNVLARIQAVHPALVILGVARHYTSVYGFTPYQLPWLQALAQMVTTIRQMGAKVMVIGPVPKPPFNVPDCLSAHLDDAAACTEPVSTEINDAGMAAERSYVTAAGGTYLDVQPWFCTATRCAVILGNIEMWRDDNHISPEYSSFLGPAMSAQLQAVMAAR
jgi:peptidoglycan/LPS O-acetylase OafA/YrhL